MAAKTEPKESAAIAAEPKSGGGAKAWIPVILVVLLAPAVCWAMAEFILLPRLEAKLSGESPDHATAAAPSKHGGGKGKEGAVPDNYEFLNVVVNLSGTMGTRYLKCSFVVTGAEPGIKEVFEAQKAQLTDVTLNVLSSLTLADLEEPGAKNVLRERLVATYNQAMGRRVAEQVYFSDFVVQ
jgi:flagellar protein FliL